MKEKMKDKDIVKDAIGDPQFYNDKMVKNKEPLKAAMDRNKNTEFKKK